MTRVKKRLLIILGAATLLILIIGIVAAVRVNGRIGSRYSGRVYSADMVPPKPVALVLGAHVKARQTPSDILEDRLRVGLDLYKKGKAGKLILSGDHGAKNYDEVNAMKSFLVRHAVAENDIFMDHAGFRTYDSCYRARDVFGVKSMIIVTNEFHLPRALYIANELGIDAVGVKSDLRDYRRAGYNNTREFFARCKAYLDVDVWPAQPRFLGPKIDINASGAVTQD